jgi:membrane fusion protein (multidrug efflux system)
LPGMYGQVKFHLRQTRKTVILPTDALIVDGEGTRVATVTPGHVIHFVSVQPGHDFGTSIEVLDGLENNATVVSNPPDTLTEGEHVNVQNDPGAQRSKL